MTNVLLLLSAILSALIGGGPSARVAGAPAAAMAGMIEREAEIAPMRDAASRPVQQLAVIAAMLAMVCLVRLFVAPVTPAWASRRRE